MKKLYFISGLGADRRVFSYLDLSFCEPVYIDWIAPLPKETLSQYAWRLREQIPEESPIVVGLSLGGMLASEMARQDPQVKAILLASNRTSKEFPSYLRVLKYMPVHKWIPGTVLKKWQWIYTYSFGVKDPQQRKMLYEVIADADIPFVRWAIGAMIHWDTIATSPHVIHIHGTADRLLRLHQVQPDYIIEGGSHTLTLDKHAEVSRLLRELI